KKKEGLSQAGNDGMKQAHGDYLIFIDSDDYIHPEMIQSLYEQLVQEDADVSSCGVMNVYANDESPQSANQDDYFVCDSQTFLKLAIFGSLKDCLYHVFSLKLSVDCVDDNFCIW
ncbi:glycosyltransferase, partial [Stenotrophomonas acidaminiphila]|nr:glycosyltransferase [Stenotrophomonas acidaminiphila]